MSAQCIESNLYRYIIHKANEPKINSKLAHTLDKDGRKILDGLTIFEN